MENQVETYKDLLFKLWTDYKDEPQLKETLSQGIELPTGYKPNCDMLWMGINPSFNSQKPEHVDWNFDQLLIDGKGYWKTISKIIKDVSCSKEHLDLFAIRKTPETFLKKVGKDVLDNPSLHFLACHLWYTQQFLEDYLKPKIIIMANKMAWAYLGLLKEYAWMGYDTIPMERTLLLPKSCEIREITGLRTDVCAEKRMVMPQDLRNRRRYNMKGTIILLSRFQGNGCPKEQQLNSSCINEIIKTYAR